MSTSSCNCVRVGGTSMPEPSRVPIAGRFTRLRRWVGRALLVLTVVGGVLWITTKAPKLLSYPGLAFGTVFVLMDLRILGRADERYERRGAIALRFTALAGSVAAAIVEGEVGWIAVYAITALTM